MSDSLIQVHEHGFANPDGTIDWVRGYGFTVGTPNRRRILDKPGADPQPDGWCYFRQEIDDDAVDGCMVVTRIRWDDPRLYTTEDAARVMRDWSTIRQEATS